MIEKQISREFESITDQLCKKEILDQLDKQFKIDLPKGMLEAEVRSVEHAMIHEKMHEKGEKDHSKIMLDEKEKKEIEKISDRRVKLALVLANIGDEHSVKVTPQELQGELEKQIRMYPGQEKTIRDYYQKNPSELSKLRGPIFEDKVMNLIKEKGKIKIKSISKDELQNIMRPKTDNKAKSKTKTVKKATPKKSSIKKTSKK